MGFNFHKVESLESFLLCCRVLDGTINGSPGRTTKEPLRVRWVQPMVNLFSYSALPLAVHAVPMQNFVISLACPDSM